MLRNTLRPSHSPTFGTTLTRLSHSFVMPSAGALIITSGSLVIEVTKVLPNKRLKLPGAHK